jgi:hypothetical protein
MTRQIALSVKAVAALVLIACAICIPKTRSTELPLALAFGAIAFIAASLTILVFNLDRRERRRLILGAAILDLVSFIAALGASYFMLSGADGQVSGIKTHLDALYFAVTILTTVGFGDIQALGQTARLLATTQMLFDFAYLAAIIALLTDRVRATR